MITADLRQRIAAVASRLWSVHPREFDDMPPSAYPTQMQGGRRAQFYADQIESLVADIGRENAELHAEVARLNGSPPAAIPGSEPASEDDAPGRDFWAIVALRRKGHDVEAYVIHGSPDCYARDILVDGDAMSDNGDTLAWASGRHPGVYRLTMNPRSSGIDDFDMNVNGVTPLFVLDPIPS